MRQAVQRLIGPGGDEWIPPPPDDDVRWKAAGRIAAISRFAALPLAALAAGVTGLLFLVLLPVCGIASIAEAMARASWAYVRKGLRRPTREHLHSL